MAEIDRGALQVLRQLQNAGFEAYLVGGCVRDLLLQRPIHDWDITTNAYPEQVCSVFSHTVPTGLQHGTVTVLLHGASFEVTTFRTEGTYRDGRHPDSVQFVPDLAQDLARRDFTINAMAMNATGNVTDLYGGQEDLKRGQIRCVGDPERRFGEDALRMLRAVRFSAELGFTIEEHTAAAARDQADLCASLSTERVRDEMEKTLLSPRPEQMETMIRWGLLRHIGLTEVNDLSQVAADPPERELRWARAALRLPQLDLSELRLEKHLVQLCMQAITIGVAPKPRLEWKKAVSQYGWEAADLAAKLAGQAELLQEIKNSGECVTLRQLAVHGADLKGFAGRQTGEALRWMLQYVLEHPDENEHERLLVLWEKRQDCHNELQNSENFRLSDH